MKLPALYTPEYEGQALSLITKVTDAESDIQLWQWGPRYDPIQADLNVISELTAAGYVQIPRQQGQFSMSHLLSQCCDIAYVTTGTQPQMWANAKDVDQVNKSPVTLAFKIENAPPDQNALPMLQFLPMPTLGEWGLVSHEGKLVAYDVGQLPNEERLKWLDLTKALYNLAEPAGWVPHNQVHSLCTSEWLYQQGITEIRARILSGKTPQERKEAKNALPLLEEAHQQVADLRVSFLKPDWLLLWKDVKRMSQDLANAYEALHEEKTKEHKSRYSLPPLTSDSSTRVPSSNGERAIHQSFGPGLLRPSLWNSETAHELQLTTPNGSLLKIKGQEDYERKALYEYINGMMGVEGLKHLLVLLDTYYLQTGGETRLVDAQVSLRQLLIRMGYPEQMADDINERRKLAHTILYLARTWVTAIEKRYEEAPRGRGRKRKQGIEYTPLLVIEKMRSSPDGGLDVPDEVKFHLGEDFYENLFGEHKQFFALPTAAALNYHAQKQQQELCLAFYLSNMVTLDPNFKVSFREMALQTGLQPEEDLDHGHDRLRDALRIIYAPEQLEKDGFIFRMAHDDIDLVLAIEYFTKACKENDLAPATLQRIKKSYQYVQAMSTQEARTKRRVAIQRLLKKDLASDVITFKPGPLLQEKARILQAQRQKAIEQNERVKIARAVKNAKKAALKDLVTAKKDE